jgi:hypothetical protein
VTDRGCSILTPLEVIIAAIPGAARVGSIRADALISVDPVEHGRRRAADLGAVPDLSVLHALMCLPLGAAVPVTDLGEGVRRLLNRAPRGCVDWSADRSRVWRSFVPAARVSLVVVRSANWRPGLRRAAVFEPFAPRVVLLTRAPRRPDDIAWEADVDRAGLWISRPGGIEEIVPAAPHVQRYVKPAGWRFAERAYAAWLTHPTAVCLSRRPDTTAGCRVSGVSRP